MNDNREIKWPTLEGRLNNPLTSVEDAIIQLQKSGLEITPLAQSILDKHHELKTK